MARYIKQGKEPNCGPVAIYNALVWAKVPIPKNTMKFVEDLCCYDGNGTSCRYIKDAINTLPIKTPDPIIRPKLSDIDRAIDKGKAVIIRYYRDENHMGHYTLCVGRTNKYYYLVNNSREYKDNKNPVKRYLRKNVRNCLRRGKLIGGAIYYPAIWMIGKVK